MKTIKLSNGVEMPQMGYGVYQVTSADDMAQIATLDTGKSLFFDHHDGEVTKMFMGWRGLV